MGVALTFDQQINNFLNNSIQDDIRISIIDMI